MTYSLSDNLSHCSQAFCNNSKAFDLILAFLTNTCNLLHLSSDSWIVLDNAIDVCLLSDVASSEDKMNFSVRSLGRWDNLSKLLHHLYTSPVLLDEVARRSYTHNNKFDKLVIYKSKQGHQIRIHARWPNNLGFEEDLAHNHRSDFASYIVAGRIHFDILEECIDSDSPLCLETCRYEDIRSSGRDETRLVCRGRGKAFITEHQVRVEAGQSYHLDKDTLHRLVVPRGDTTGSLSLVFRNPRTRDNTIMLTSKPRGIELEGNPTMGVNQLKQGICKIVKHFQL